VTAAAAAYGDFVARARRRVQDFAWTASDRAGRRAAVALVIVPGDEEAPSFVITRRASRLTSHAAQWALPGGRIDEDESAVAAALRELREEVGVDLDVGTVLGRLDDYPTRSGYVITPIVLAAAHRVDLDPNPDEVAAAYRVPIAELSGEGVPRFVRIPESDRPVIQFPLLGSLIHAPTGAIIYQFRDLIVSGLTTRVAELESPVWAWR
jgi:8-oxo-dGTP pyrophosphatase MutT (NUDIX family)